MDVQLKRAIEEVSTAFEAFKEKNDERLDAIEQGTGTSEITTAVGRANDDVSALQKDFADLKAENEKMAKLVTDLETLTARPGAGADSEAEAKKMRDAAMFLALAKNDTVPADLPPATAADLETFAAYQTAFPKFMRRGDKVGDVQAAMSVGSSPDGGYWVTPDTGGRIVELVYESSPMRSVAAIESISSDALEGIFDLDEAADGWVGETGARTETDTPEIGKYRIEAHEQYAAPKTTQKVLDDAAVDVEGWLTRKVSGRFARREATAFVVGDGVAKPRGFLTYPAGVPSATTWNVIEQVKTGVNGDFHATLPGDTLIDVVFGLKTAYRTGANWAMNRSVVAAVRKIKDGDGNYMWTLDFSTQQGGLLLGYPITEMEDMPDLATGSLSMAYGNFGEAYQIVDRIGIRTLRDPFTDKPYIVFYSTKRVGGDVLNFEALKLIDFSA